jgi:recombinase
MRFQSSVGSKGIPKNAHLHPNWVRKRTVVEANRRSSIFFFGLQIAEQRGRGKTEMEQRIRDLVTGELTLDYFMRRSAEGWKLVSVEWVRQAESTLPHADAESARVNADKVLSTSIEVPYGLQVAEQGNHLEENPLESTVLMLILEQIVKERRISEIANQLNLAGYRTRKGKPWGPTAVFDLLPRLIEAGPSLLKSAAWRERRPSTIQPN